MNGVNRWNMLHILAPFLALVTALLFLDKMPNNKPYFIGFGYYSPLTFIFFSLILIAVSICPLLIVKETGRNFLMFFAVYPFWAFVAVVPQFASYAYSGAWASWLIFLISMIVQILIMDNLEER